MANLPEHGPDPTVDSDRGSGTTNPETGPESSNVAGRPPVERPRTAFHEPNETPDEERMRFNEREALTAGGSFDAVAPPGDDPEG